MKKTDCPLCHAERVLIFHTKDQNKEHCIPQISTGNTYLDLHGEGYDWSHAEVCPNLKFALDKKKLLEFYVSGKPFAPITDNLSFEQYQGIVKRKNFTLKAGLDRVLNGSGEMIWQPYVCISSPAFDYLMTYGPDGQTAFDLLKHRLHCGDIINTGVNKLQLTQKGEVLELDAI